MVGQFPPELWCDVDSVNFGHDLDVSAGANLLAAAPAAEFHLRRVLVFNLLLLLVLHPHPVLHSSLELKPQDLEQTRFKLTSSPGSTAELTHLVTVVGLF